MNPSSRPCWASVYGTHDILSSQYCYVLEHLHTQQSLTNHTSQWHTEGGVGVFNLPPPKFRRPSKIVPNPTRLWKLLKIAEFRTPRLQDVWKKGSKILKLPPVRNCFTLAMTNKLAVIINCLKVPKIRNFYYMKWNFLYQITASSRTLD